MKKCRRVARGELLKVKSCFVGAERDATDMVERACSDVIVACVSLSQERSQLRRPERGLAKVKMLFKTAS